MPFYDRMELIAAALRTVYKALLEGIVLVVSCFFLFLGNVRSALIVTATLLIAPLVTFIVMNQIGLTANLMSLGGLVIAIGMMVDGSVVVVENVYRHLSEQRPGAGHLHGPRYSSGERSRTTGHLRHPDHHAGVPAHSVPARHGRQNVSALAYTIMIALLVSLVCR